MVLHCAIDTMKLDGRAKFDGKIAAEFAGIGNFEGSVTYSEEGYSLLRDSDTDIQILGGSANETADKMLECITSGDEFPYDMCYLRYTIHGDNGPPDDEMPDIIQAWNEKYASPRFRIGTTKELFETFESRYGDVIPSYGGDMTPTWEDGAASSARETALNRAASARLAQGQILWAMLGASESYPESLFRNGFRNAVLYSEHTWGSAASGPEPDAPFTIDQWNRKKMFADSADIYSPC